LSICPLFAIFTGVGIVFEEKIILSPGWKLKGNCFFEILSKILPGSP